MRARTCCQGIFGTFCVASMKHDLVTGGDETPGRQRPKPSDEPVKKKRAIGFVVGSIGPLVSGRRDGRLVWESICAETLTDDRAQQVPSGSGSPQIAALHVAGTGPCLEHSDFESTFPFPVQSNNPAGATASGQAACDWTHLAVVCQIVTSSLRSGQRVMDVMDVQHSSNNPAPTFLLPKSVAHTNPFMGLIIKKPQLVVDR